MVFHYNARKRKMVHRGKVLFRSFTNEQPAEVSSKDSLPHLSIFSILCRNFVHRNQARTYMKYIEVTFGTEPCNSIVTDVVSALAGEIGFESFVECEGGVQGYIQQALFDEAALQEMVADFPLPDVRITYVVKEAEDKNWNEEWEKNFFQPIVIEGRCCIHSTFHRDTPQTEYEILINPQMAFGTGHHETTSSIIGELLEADLQGKTVLDMGCGTSILAILASMRGASRVTAIDIDDWCVNNSKDNIALNHIHNIQVELGDARLLENRSPFDVIIANINRNILLADLPHYVACMHPGSEIYMSGFYVEDIPCLRERAEQLGLTFVHHREKNRWAAVKFIR